MPPETISTEPADPATADLEWAVCAGCRAVTYGKKLIRNLKVCPDCGHHHRLTARERIDQLFDPDTLTVLDLPVHSQDVLGFVDTMPYPQRLARARLRTGLQEAVLVATGEIQGQQVVAAVMDFGFLGGSLGASVGELIATAAQLAVRRRCPLLLVTASGGARMQEGPISLMQMAKTSQALARVDEAGLLSISLITDPTYGGVAASFATQCRIIVAEPGARLGFAGRRVIEQTIGQTLPATFQSAQFLLERGFIDSIKPRSALRPTLHKLLAIGTRRPVSHHLSVPLSVPHEVPASPALPVPHDAPPASPIVIRDPAQLERIDPWRAVQGARDLGRPTTLDYVDRAFRDFEELHGDRVGADCPAIVGGMATLSGIPVMVIGHQRGHTPREVAARQYGMASPAGHRKAIRLMRLAATLGLPIVTFVDTPGAHPGVEAEENGQAFAIAQCLDLMARLPVPLVTVIIGEGGSGGALSLAVANEVLITERAVYSVISPEGCASILWEDPSMAARAAAALQVDARSLLRMGVVDGVIPEPAGGSQANHQEAGRRLGAALRSVLPRLTELGPAELIRARRARFESFGRSLADPAGSRGR